MRGTLRGVAMKEMTLSRESLIARITRSAVPCTGAVAVEILRAGSRQQGMDAVSPLLDVVHDWRLPLRQLHSLLRYARDRD